MGSVLSTSLAPQTAYRERPKCERWEVMQLHQPPPQRIHFPWPFTYQVSSQEITSSSHLPQRVSFYIHHIISFLHDDSPLLSISLRMRSLLSSFLCLSPSRRETL